MDYLIYNLADTHLHPLADTALLSESERTTAEKRGNTYVLTRCLLRHELARRLGCSPQSIRFCYGEHGKPQCDGIHFNISHSGDCFAMAFDAAPIGIDVECIRTRPRLKALARRIMPPEQFAAFCQRHCPPEEFYTCWCAAEALVKQTGSSIWRAASYPYIYEHGQIRLRNHEGGGLHVHTFTPMPGYQGAVATLQP